MRGISSYGESTRDHLSDNQMRRKEGLMDVMEGRGLVGEYGH